MLRDLGRASWQGWCMLGVVEDTLAGAVNGHAAWSESLSEMLMQVVGAFSNARVRRRGRDYLLGLLSRAERKNSWQLAEFAGDASPDWLGQEPGTSERRGSSGWTRWRRRCRTRLQRTFRRSGRTWR